MPIDRTNSAAALAASNPPSIGKAIELNKISEGIGNFGLLGVGFLGKSWFSDGINSPVLFINNPSLPQKEGGLTRHLPGEQEPTFSQPASQQESAPSPADELTSPNGSRSANKICKTCNLCYL